MEGFWQPEHMLHAATEGGATALGMESEIGQIALDFRADCVALHLRRPHLVPHNDPLGALVHTGPGACERCYRGRRGLVEQGRPTRCDMTEVMRVRAAAAVWARAGG